MENNGLTKEESLISDLLIDAWNNFIEIKDDQTTDDYIQFKNGIHACQYVLMHRAIRKIYPDYWR